MTVVGGSDGDRQLWELSYPQVCISAAVTHKQWQIYRHTQEFLTEEDKIFFKTHVANINKGMVKSKSLLVIEYSQQ